MRPRETRIPIDLVPTAELLRLYERVFAPLDSVGRRRLLETARTNGWDRAWETEMPASYRHLVSPLSALLRWRYRYS